MLTGCSVSGQCADWVVFDTPADALADATSAVIGTVGEKDGTAGILGYTVNGWTVQVDEWVKGSGGDTIRVLSSPVTCSEGSPYPTGDPFEAASGPQVIFLHDEDGALRTLTPYQGIVPVAPDGTVPDAWPSGMPGD